MVSYSEEISRWKEHGPDVVPAYHAVDPKGIDDLVKIAPVHQDLIAFWKERGSANFNTDSQGESVSTWITNQLLGPVEIIDLIQGTFGIVEDLLPVGLPFFNMFDLEFLVLTIDGEIAQVNPDGSKRQVSTKLQEFVGQLIEWPTFYEKVD